jgi:glycosyltransferase involved in cell wall biosynthesis
MRPELMPPCGACAIGSSTHKDRTVAFAAQFVARKGIDVLLDAWAEVAPELSGWRLHLAGFGPRATQVCSWANGRPDVTVTVAPNRRALHDLLSSAAVLVLPSRAGRWWREQIGFPVLEGLSHGCVIICTVDSGLAPWLRDHGQVVVEGGDAPALAAALHRVCTSWPWPTALRALPAEDTRHVAERWFNELARDASRQRAAS